MPDPRCCDLLQDQDGRLSQGDLIRGAVFLERFLRDGDDITIDCVEFPLVYVLTQDCDLEGDQRVQEGDGETHNGFLVSAMVAPVYLKDHLKSGRHLERIRTRDDKPIVMPPLGGDAWKRIVSNSDARYHYLRFSEASELNDGVIDFKHYFTVATDALRRYRAVGYCGRLANLDRADVSQRFAAYLARIGFPSP